MFEFAFVQPLFEFAYARPQFAPLFELPPNSHSSSIVLPTIGEMDFVLFKKPVESLLIKFFV
jgi:hypothetical protein